MNLRLPPFAFTKGLHDLGNDCYAWLQPDGSWGLSNAGLVTDGDQALLIDTLFDFTLTKEMLAAMRSSIAAAKNIQTLVNTHSNGDHCNGNGLIEGGEIIASAQTLQGMAEETPQMMLGYLKQADQLGDFGTYFRHCFGRFDFASVTRRLPDRTFAGHLDLHVGKRLVQLIEVGPAHTTGDTIVHVPDAAILFSGDILFIEGHPLMWAGPVENWLKACRVMLDLQPKIVVPGHGPLTDARGIQAIIDYFEYVAEESRKHFDAGRSISEAAALMVTRYRQWHDAERIAVNIAIMYSQFQGDASVPKMPALFGLMADFSKHLQTVSQ